MSLHIWCCQGHLKPSSCATFMQLSLGQSCHRQKKSCIYARRVALVVSNSLQACEQTMCGRPGFSVRGLGAGGRFSRQEYWSVLANTGCHIFLKHCISCCPSHQLP